MDAVLSEKEVMVRNVRLFLKGFIVQRSIRGGMKYNSSKTPSKWFEEGRNFESRRAEHPLYGYDTTLLHVIYNMTRHNRSHLQSKEIEKDFLHRMIYRVEEVFNLLRSKFGEDVIEQLGLGSVK